MRTRRDHLCGNAIVHPRWLRTAAITLLIVAAGYSLKAEVVVISNRSRHEVTLKVPSRGRNYVVPPGDVVPIPCAGGLSVSFQSGDQRRNFQLDASSMYVLGDGVGGPELRRIGLEADAAYSIPPQGLLPTPEQAAEHVSDPPNIVIPVKILVDEEEPAKREVWEKRLRDRVAEASDILQRYCFVRFEVVAVDTWQSDNRLTDFDRLFTEFSQQVQAAPARVAIGFTSQRHLTVGRTHLGGTRGPLDTHILVREWSQVASESERLEILLHEFGHFLGAVHSPERDSVMRIVLADKKARARAFQIRFDPLNTLAMCLVSEELRLHPHTRLSQLRLETQLELYKLYLEIAHSLPNDPAARHYLGLIDHTRLAPLVAGSQLVLRAIVVAAEQNAELPEEGTVLGQLQFRLKGDPLGELYVRRGALAAKRLPPEIAARAFLIGLSIAADRSDTLRRHPLAGAVYSRLESDAARQHRLAVLGTPTARGRADLLQHFAVSAALAAIVGPLAAESVGLLKEQQDSNGGSGFSFADYQADLAGIAFAEAVLSGKERLDKLQSFVWPQYLPDPQGLVEGLTRDAFARQFGSLADQRFLAARAAIAERVKRLEAERAGAGQELP